MIYRIVWRRGRSDQEAVGTRPQIQALADYLAHTFRVAPIIQPVGGPRGTKHVRR